MNRNIFITNIDYLVSDRHVHEIAHMMYDTNETIRFLDPNDETVIKPPEVVNELLRAEELWSTTEDQFGNRTTYRTAIGMSHEVQSALGMYREVYEKNVHDTERLREERDERIAEVERLRKERDERIAEIERLRNAGFWTRVVWVFMGLKP